MKQELHFTPFYTVFKREIQRFLKVMVQTVLTPLINSFLYLLIFGVSLGRHIQTSQGVSYLAFLIPGLVMMGCLNNAFQNSSSSIIAGKFGGDLEDFRVSPLSHQQVIWAMSLGGLVRGVVVGLVTFLLGLLFYRLSEGQVLPVAHPFILFYFVAVGGLAFAKLGISVAFWAKNFDQLSAISGFILLPLIYLGGVFFSIENLHPAWKIVAKVNPLLYLINGVRYGLLGVSDVDLQLATIVSLATLIVFHILAYRGLKQGSFVRW